ncbi:MAG: Spy/CpxP family protein refolding chaperone [Sulfuritalea sp.]|nr:Spy/CpxP family protein refolding chaperone [Sulfuritalea sp.]
MNLNRKIIAGFLAASAALFGVAYAQGPGYDSDGKPGMRRGSMQQGGMMDPGVRVEQRLTRLKNELKLTAEQEPLWQVFAEKSKAEAGKGMQAMRERMKDDKPVSAPERMAQMQGIMKQRLAAMESVNESFNRLYAGLTPEQKAAADKHFSAAGRPQAGPGPGRGAPRSTPGAAEPRKG